MTFHATISWQMGQDPGSIVYWERTINFMNSGFRKWLKGTDIYAQYDTLPMSAR